MAITSIKTGSSFTNLTKYDSFLAGNTAFSPSSYESIASATGTGSSGTITFNSIPSGYSSLQVRFTAKSTDTSGGVGYVFFYSNNSTRYYWHSLYGTGSTAVTANGSSGQGYMYGGLAYGAAGIANIYGVGIVDILDYASTTKNKTYRMFYGQDTNNVYSGNVSTGSYLESTNAITSLTFTADLGNFTTGSTFALYGIKGA